MDKEFIQAIREVIKSEVEPIKAQLNEHTQLLRAIEHKTNVIAAANNWADIAKLKLVK